MQRYYYNEGDKLVSEEVNPITLRIVCLDDKIDEVMGALDNQNLHLKSTDFKLSPLLKGKTEYLKWQQNSLTAAKTPTHVSLDADDDEEEEEEEEE